MSGKGIFIYAYVNFLDFENAFDSIHRTSLWKILQQYGIPQKIINIIPFFTTIFPAVCKITAQALLSSRVFARVVLCPPFYSY